MTDKARRVCRDGGDVIDEVRRACRDGDDVIDEARGTSGDRGGMALPSTADISNMGMSQLRLLRSGTHHRT